MTEGGVAAADGSAGVQAVTAADEDDKSARHGEGDEQSGEDGAETSDAACEDGMQEGSC